MNKTRHRTYIRNIEERSRNYCYRGKAISIAHFECVFVCVCVSVVLVIQHEMRMRLIVMSSVTCLAVPYFFHISHKRRDFLKNKTKVTDHKIRVLVFSTTFV